MMTYTARFSRYRNGERRIGSPYHLPGMETFKDAAACAHLVLRGLQSADPASDYSIISLETDAHGVECKGIHMFETYEEMEDRLRVGS